MTTQSSRCAVCHRPLTDPVSVARGAGPICAGKNQIGGGGHVTAAPATTLPLDITIIDPEDTMVLAPVSLEDRPLSPSECEQFAGYERIIEHGLQTFVDVGNALLAIRNGKLYRERYPTFEDYCQARWGFLGSRARQLISAAQVVDNLKSVTMVTPGNERQARPLMGLDPEGQREAWSRVVEFAPESGITAAHVQDTVDALTSHNPHPCTLVQDKVPPVPILLPLSRCPFCGGQAELMADPDHYEFEIGCQQCSAIVSFPFADTAADAATHWNTRPHAEN